MRILLSTLSSGAEHPEDINALSQDHGLANDRMQFDAMTQVESNLLSNDEIERMRPTIHAAQAVNCSDGAWIKAHEAYSRLSDGTPILSRSARCAIYLVRDPRDVAVSMTFHMDSELDEVIRRLNSPSAQSISRLKHMSYGLRDWSSHAASWLDQTDIPVLMIRYEDLRTDTLKQFRRALDFIGAEYDPEAAARAVAFSDFAELQRQEQKNGFRERGKRQKLFFRQGQIGDWARHLNPSQIHAIESNHAVMMARLGYHTTEIPR